MRLAFFSLLLMIGLQPGTVLAADAEPQIYFFWSASCPYSKSVRMFLQSAQRQDKALRVRDFEVDHSPENIELMAKVYVKVGLPGLGVVPLVVIGSHAIVGYEDDATTARDILDAIKDCRKQGCEDELRELIEAPRGLEEVLAPEPGNSLSCTTQRYGAMEISAAAGQ